MSGGSTAVPFAARVAGGVGAAWLRLQCATWRKRSEGLASFSAALADDEPALVVFWHGSYVPLFALLRGHRSIVFSSRSARGRVISEIARRFGFEPLLLADGGGRGSLRRMREALARIPNAGIAADGPLGPRHSVKRGAVQLASELGARILPVAVASDRKRVLAGRWDRMELPRLWSRVALVAGEPLRVPAGLDESSLGVWRKRVREALERCQRRAEALLVAPPRDVRARAAGPHRPQDRAPSADPDGFERAAQPASLEGAGRDDAVRG